MRGEEDLDLGIGDVEVLCRGHAGVGVLVLELHFLGKLGLVGVLLDLDQLVRLSYAGLGGAAAEHSHRNGMIFRIGKGLVNPFCREHIEGIRELGVIRQHQGIIVFGGRHKGDNLDAGRLSLFNDKAHGLRGNRPEDDDINTLRDVVLHRVDLCSGVELAVGILGVPAFRLHRRHEGVCQGLEEIAAEAEGNKGRRGFFVRCIGGDAEGEDQHDCEKNRDAFFHGFSSVCFSFLFSLMAIHKC